MEGEKFFNINGVEYKAVFMYGYNGHYYCTVYNNESGRYLGQIVDIRKSDYDVEKRIAKFVDENE